MWKNVKKWIPVFQNRFSFWELGGPLKQGLIFKPHSSWVFFFNVEEVFINSQSQTRIMAFKGLWVKLPKWFPIIKTFNKNIKLILFLRGWYVIWKCFSKVPSFLKNRSKVKWGNHQPLNSIDRTRITYSYNITILRLLGESLEKYNLNVTLMRNCKIYIIRKKMVTIP